MNYKKIYFQIIRNRRKNPLPLDSYGEVHHIKPSSFGGAKLDTPENLIRLSAREHFIVHFLLYKMYKYRSQVLFPHSAHEKNRFYKITCAFNIMINTKTKSQKRLNKNINNRAFEQLRKTVSEQQTKYPFKLVKNMFDFYIQNNLTPRTIDVLNKQFNTNFKYDNLKKLFYKHNLKITTRSGYSVLNPKYSKEMIKNMFDFYIQNNLYPQKIDVLNKQFNTNFKYSTLRRLFNKNNLKISDYRTSSIIKYHYDKN